MAGKDTELSVPADSN